MLTFPLEPTSERADPAFKNPASCKKWLKRLQYDNPVDTQWLVRDQLDEFNRYPLRSVDRLETMERLRPAVHALQDQCAGKLAGRPLPLAERELAILDSVTALWQAMATGYYRCLLDFEQGDKSLRRHGALLCHRALTYCGKVIYEFLRSGYEFDGDQWRQLHAVFLFAEERDLLSSAVKDEFHVGEETPTARHIYLKVLLSCHARVQELTLHEQNLLDNWLSQWMDNFTIEHSCMISRGDAPPLAVDPASARGLQPFKPEFIESDNIRYIPMVPISKLIRVKTILLQQGESPQRLELSGNHDRIDCLKLLDHLHRHWCEPRGARQAERQPYNQAVQVRYNLDDAYCWVAGEPFDPQKKSGTAMEEAWHAQDISILGARLTRVAEAGTGARVALHQLLAVQIGEAIRMAVTVWVSITQAGEMNMGIHFLPGTASPVGVHLPGRAGVPAPKPVAGLLLSDLPKLGIPASLLLPRGMYVMDRIVEISRARQPRQRLKLRFSVEAGLNYERVGYAAA